MPSHSQQASHQGPTQEQEGDRAGGFQWSQLKYYFLAYMAFTTLSAYIKNDKDNTTVGTDPAPTAVIEASQFKMTPNLKNSTFVKIEPPLNKWRTAETENGESVKLSSFEQVVFENSQRDALYFAPLYEQPELYEFELYVNDLENFKRGSDETVLKLDGVQISSVGSQMKNLKIQLTDNVKNNGSLFLHAFIAKHGDDIAGYKRFQLNSYFPKRKLVKLHKLIGGNDENIEDQEIQEVSVQESPDHLDIVSYWHPNVTVLLCDPPGLIDTKQIPPAMYDVFPLDPENKRDNLTGLVTQYYPIIYQNKFWQLKDHMTEINSTVATVDLNLSIESSAFWKIQALVVFSDGMKQQEEQISAISGGVAGDGSQFDALKKILIETNPYLLAITIGVSLLHSLLEFLAFKNDISHWKNKKNNVGVSTRSIVANVIQQVITLLYLIDSSEGTSFMILASQGFGILVEAWKITTIVKIEVTHPEGRLLPSIKITDKYELTETEAKTKEYDEIAFKYLYFIAAPLLLAYSVYSVLYKEHKSWYSFIVTTLVGFVYTYGFLTLVPAVYINYRLKSVAHVPKKAMAYKVVNTFIDDLFAFVIKMPWLHRLATLRDDVIFFIYLYQTWIYRVDYTRINEFGQGGDDDEETKEAGETKEEEKKTK